MKPWRWRYRDSGLDSAIEPAVSAGYQHSTIIKLAARVKPGGIGVTDIPTATNKQPFEEMRSL